MVEKSELLKSNMTIDNTCIALNQVSKRVDTPEGSLDIVKDISLEVKSGEALVIRGASGSGKTTLLGLMAGLDQSSSGEVRLLGEVMDGKNEEQRAHVRAGRVGFVFQSFHLVRGATALQNVLLPLELNGQANARQLALDSLRDVGLEEKRDTPVERLSGGEQQRVAIARAYAMKPLILFADEPTGNLDAKTGEQITDLMFQLRDEQGSSLVLVTHEEELASRGDRQIRIESGQLQAS